MPTIGARGANQVMIRLANGFAARGMAVDLVVAKASGEFESSVSPSVRVVNLDSSGVLKSLPRLARYLRRERPQVLLTAMDYVNVLSIFIRALVAPRTRIFVTCHTSLLKSARNSPWLRDRLLPLAVRLTYRHADGVIAVSRGVAETLSSVAGISSDRIRVIHNPVVAPDFAAKAAAPVDHPWFEPGAPPVILGAGSLTKAKDFETLIRALAKVRVAKPVRLMILGEGEERKNLEALVTSLVLQDNVELRGFVANPFAYMARAAVFVLSSRWEGFGLALAEALACGTRVVSTDCPSGPSEILRGGELGPLVAVGDVDGLAKAILQQLNQTPDRERLQREGAKFSVENAVDEYSAALEIKPAHRISNGTSAVYSSATDVAAPRQQPKFAVIQMGARLHYAVPAVLADAGMLHVLYTDISANTFEESILKWWPPSLRPTALRRFSSRRLPSNIPHAVVHGYAYPTVQQYLFDHFAGRRKKSATLVHRLGIGGHALAREACAHHFHGSNALYVHPCVSTDAIREAKRQELFVVLEAVSEPFNKRVETQEYKKYGEKLPYPEAEIEENISFFKAEALQANLVLAASPFVRSGLIELGLAPNSISVVPYGLEENFFDRKPEPQPGRVLYAGNVGYLKGVQYLAEAARLLSERGFRGEVRVVGPSEKHLLRKPEFYGPIFVGLLSRHEVKSEFLGADVFVLPTLSDGFGIVLLEAMAAGVPVISTPNCGAVVRDGENGFIVPVRDSAAIAERIEQIIEDRQLRQRLSEGALMTAREHSLKNYRDRLVRAILSRFQS